MKGNISDEILDEIDLDILRALQENGKLTTKELADRVHLTTSPVHNGKNGWRSWGISRNMLLYWIPRSWVAV